MQELLAQLAENQQEKKQFKKFFKVLKQLKQEDKDINQLNNGQKIDIKNIAQTETQAGAFARAVLDYIKEKDNNISPEVPVNLSSARVANILEENQIISRMPELGQNIPNPANNSTLINIYVPKNTTIAKIQIISSLGRWAAEKILSEGDQQVEFNTADFVAGVYFYTLYLNNKPVSTKRMVIVK